MPLLATCQNFSPWHSAHCFPFLASITSSVGEVAVPELCDTDLSDTSIIDNAAMFSTDEQCSGRFSVTVEKACSNCRVL